MHPNLDKSIQMLTEGGYTCVPCRGAAVITDAHRGIRPMPELAESAQDLRGAFAAGKAASIQSALAALSRQ